jgi:ferredoxin
VSGGVSPFVRRCVASRSGGVAKPKLGGRVFARKEKAVSEQVRVQIDRDECILCGSCWDACPEVFEESPDDGLSQIVEEYRANNEPGEGEVPADLTDCAAAAALDCPVEIIHVG